MPGRSEVSGGVWVTVGSDHRISCRLELDDELATLNFFGGSMDLSLSMSVPVIERCQILLDEAKAALSKSASST